MSWWSPWRGRLASFLSLSLWVAWVGATAGAEASQRSLDLSIGEPSRRVLARVTNHCGGTVLVSRYVRSALEMNRESHTDSSTVAMPTWRRIIWGVRVIGVRRRSVSYTLAAIRCVLQKDVLELCPRSFDVFLQVGFVVENPKPKQQVEQGLKMDRINEINDWFWNPV